MPGGYCFFHSPDHAEDRKKAWSQGGKRTQAKDVVEDPEPHRLETTADVLDLLAQAAGVALAVPGASLSKAKTLNAISATALRVVEAVDWDSRIAELESKMETSA